MICNNLIEAFILAGGKSMRMGSDKGLIPYKGKHMIQWTTEKLAILNIKTSIIAHNPMYKLFNSLK